MTTHDLSVDGVRIELPLRMSAVKAFEEATGTAFDEMMTDDRPDVNDLARLVYCALTDQGAELPEFDEWSRGRPWPDMVGIGLALQADSVKRIEAVMSGHMRFLARELPSQEPGKGRG